MALLALCLSCISILSIPIHAQTIGGNVYGGGNQGDLEGNANVELKGGTVQGNVYGGARMADITGRTYVHINGAEASSQLVVRAVYGGNDIAGTIGTGGEDMPFAPCVPTEPTDCQVDNTWNAFIQATTNTTYPVVIGSLFGGGNGAYTYNEDDTEVTVDGITYPINCRPTLAKTYLHINGGVYGHIYGGGNAATVTDHTVIHIENQTSLSDALNRIPQSHAAHLGLIKDTDYRIDGENMVFDFHASRVFGGNNLATMAIRPTWHLKRAVINNLYSGGNRGMMTYPNGIILAIRSESMWVHNVYGGCRIADVNPSESNGEGDLVDETLYGHDFHAGYATRVYITKGHVNNVYGGNDISGDVYYGSNVDIHGGLIGNVYGGGNGSYAYTDNPDWAATHPEDADLLYSTEGFERSVDALYHYRPHAASTLIHLSGQRDETLIVAGGVFCGGNSATLATNDDPTKAKASVRVGKYVIADALFLGSNGEHMVSPKVIKKYKAEENGIKFSQIDLTDADQMKRYMEAVEVHIKPQPIWDDLALTTHIGSLYFGGNKGSMSYKGPARITLPRDLIIYEKVSGGCNDACVKSVEEGGVIYNAPYHGGLLEPGIDTLGMKNVKVILNMNAYLKPMELVKEFDASGEYVVRTDFVWDITEKKYYETFDNKVEYNNTFVDANVYGGCFNSGHIKGSTIINISKRLIHPEVYAERPDILTATGEDVYGSALAIYGAGYGEESFVDGDTQINFTDSACVLLAFGGGEMGTVTGNTEVNLDRNLKMPDEEGKTRLNIYKVYAGGYEGPVLGNTTLNLQGGGVMRAFAGACNADIGGHTTAIVGWSDAVQDIYNYGRPYVKNAVFGGNDFGGQIHGSAKRTITVNRHDGSTEERQVKSQTYVQYLSGEMGKAIYGGSYGSYKYTDPTIYTKPQISDPTFLTEITDDDGAVICTNTFVDIASQSRSEKDIIGSGTLTDPKMLTAIVGGGRGYRNLPGYVRVHQTYVLLHATPRSKRNDHAHMAYRVYGGGNLSMVDNTRIDAYSGNVDMLFGGTHGVKTINPDDNVSYNVGNTLINIYEGMDYPNMNVFGAGANSGADKAVINLYGGQMNDVHGGAYTEGYTAESHINVPQGSTAQMNALFGGGLGEEEGRPCDVGVSNINYASALASIEKGIYGGNHTARVTTENNVTISSKVKSKDGTLQSVFGAGLGALTVSGFTNIDLQSGALVANVYGGGEEGKVYNHYSYYGNTQEGTDAVTNYYSNTPHQHGNWINSTIQPTITQALPKATDGRYNTHIRIQRGAVVEGNVYGGGLGDVAALSGTSHVELLGGTVAGDIYGGGYAGTMPRMTAATHGFIATEENQQTIATYCQIDGGEVRNVFGGGYKGLVAGNSRVAIGNNTGTTFYSGIPSIQRSVYGGGEMAEVSETATVDMWNGYVGYIYDKDNQRYTQLLNIENDNHTIKLEQNGNVYAAGYGEGAIVMHTQLNIHGGTVRNSVYGGGEIAAVGRGSVKLENNKYVLDKFTEGGSTSVCLYGGLVEGDVFGGGRGFSYDQSGNMIGEGRFYTDGYVFGTTDVRVYRGTVGTDASLAEGKGNVFGGGNVGYVYSPGKKYDGVTEESTGLINGHYYTNNNFTDRTEDCQVVVSARCKVLEAVSINGHDYAVGDYVSTEDLNTLDYNAVEWQKLDNMGITIRNAIFAGGNVTLGDDKIYANAVTVYGNATASVIDVYAKDFIRIGGVHVGGLYGDGNLTFVDGYRELNITNYGTDYYNLSEHISYEEYLTLEEREKDYYSLIYSPKENVEFSYNGIRFAYEKSTSAYPVEVQQQAYETMMAAWMAMMEAKWEPTGENYTAKEDISFEGYVQGTVLNADDYTTMLDLWEMSMTEKWDVKGECSITSGRMMNTVQRADFCGIFGSRILLHGAQDRVPEEVDYTNYTINRVGEISLNVVKREQNGHTKNDIDHGNYFGIHNVVNFLGALTSDIQFTDEREAVNSLNPSDGRTYLEYKKDNLNNRTRNNASSDNMVAMSSGVFLELVKELDANGNKVYGPITGVVQLDLINVQPGEGGGYVYAKNEHGTPKEVSEEDKNHQVLSAANHGAITHAAYTYEEDESHLQLYQTSGNFVHPQKRIVDDCFPRGGYYKPNEEGYSPAHYWYIRGDYYVYDQYISAYTGASQAYSEAANIPLTITAGSDGRLELISINPNKYAYFKGKPYMNKILTEEDQITINGVTYGMNDPISYWDYNQLSAADKIYFTDITYVAVYDAEIDGKQYKEGDVLLQEEFEELIGKNGTVASLDRTDVMAEEIFRISNEISQDTGYLLTFDMDNPLDWDNYYTKFVSGNKSSVVQSAYDKLTNSEQATYIEGPTMLCQESGIYGQRSYKLNDLVDESSYHAQDAIKDKLDSYLNDVPQAVFEPAYVALQEITFTIGSDSYHMYKGSYISTNMYNKLSATVKSAFDEAYICTNTIETADKQYIINGDLLPKKEYDNLVAMSNDANNTYLYDEDMSKHFTTAYICTEAGSYGGAYFEKTKHYDALQYCNLPKSEREKFVFNKDALDLLYTNFNEDMTLYGEPYGIVQHVNYTATYNGNDDVTLVSSDNQLNGLTIKKGDSFTRMQYESILNEQAHYMPVIVKDIHANYYIVTEEFKKGNAWYPVGRNITEEMYDMLTEDQKEKIHIIAPNTFNEIGTYYFCVEDYKPTSNVPTIETNSNGDVPVGLIISNETYGQLPNYQKNFIIHGHAPIETSTLYVSRESDILNLSEDKVITVELKYTYKESNAEGSDYEIFVERHIVNIHLIFKSGLPTIGDLTPPNTVLPNTTIGLTVPSVTKGAYEIIGGGWEIFESRSDANEHKNGKAYQNNATPMFWYQNDYYIAYFAKTYLGKAYSNAVPVSVANYHRMGEVMNHPEYMYIDHKDVDRASKIYLDAAEYENSSIAAGTTKNDLDYLKELYDKTVDGSSLDANVAQCRNLVFILRSDMAPKEAKDNWTPIGQESKCFAGTLHGNGYTISGLNNSLFGHLCGSVYNLGVTGTFTGGGVADNGGDASDGYAKNCWVYTTATPAPATNAVIGTGGTVENGYSHENNAYASRVEVIAKSDAAFKKGEVAYLLNRFYLDKRYNNAMDIANSDYVENYYVDGDFIYANGEIPLGTDIRYDYSTQTYVPIYPNDYIFFGQQLTYDEGTHSDWPTHHNNGNRIYRAPAYYLSKQIDKVFYNADASFTDSYKGIPIHHKLTAIDFTGNGDKAYTDSEAYLPYLDYEGLTDIDIDDLTPNLLVYANPIQDAASYQILSNYLHEPTLYLQEYDAISKQTNQSAMRGHLVDLTSDGAYQATRDHFLVDKENFNAPIAYQYEDGYHMWYQRTPERFANGDGKGWDIVCLPFTAGLVTTHQKGEITHFYGDDDAMHEYWLRELKKVDGDKATFSRPEASDYKYTAESTFLYDYYYSKYGQQDANTDKYQNYYTEDRTYDGYAYLTAATPYIIAFPGERYYEFDMSGTFMPQHTGGAINRLEKQVVTMVSEDNAQIAVSDDESKATAVGNHTFKGIYQNDNLINAHLIDSVGGSFNTTTEVTKAVPFRGYLETSSSPAPPKRIFISGEAEENEPIEEITERGLTIYGKNQAIYIESTLEYEAKVTIYSMSGQVVRHVTVQPMSKEIVPVSSRGIYFVNQKKIAVL